MPGSTLNTSIQYQRLARPILHLRDQDRDFGTTGLVFETETETFLFWSRVRDRDREFFYFGLVFETKTETFLFWSRVRD